MPKKVPTLRRETAGTPQSKPVSAASGTASGAKSRASNRKHFPIIGIGASAGGLAAFEAFFSALPTDPGMGMAFVVVQHLSPNHESILAELIRRYTRLPVYQVLNGMAVKPDSIYVLPPNCEMALLNRRLHLLEPQGPHRHHLPIDYFFRSLAQDLNERAIGIILSGTANDGTQGLRAIKAEGGLTMAQTPATTEFDSMPRSAIEAGVVDFVLPPAEMPAQLAAYGARVDGGVRRRRGSAPGLADTDLAAIVVELRNQTNHDFSHYKDNTVIRRVEQRMATRLIETAADYVAHLRRNPSEAEALFQDLLIGVTNFFRDPHVFEALQHQIIPRLVSEKPGGQAIRVWVPGCSSGEEAYSIAILLQEETQSLQRTGKLQVFATDLDGRAIERARSGIYPQSIKADVKPEWLARWFTEQADGNYRINKAIRDLVVFSTHDLTRDPPFSKLDLISCRNVLIYLKPEMQSRVLSVFDYALLPAGFLLLGTSETVGDLGSLFVTLDLKAKLYQHKASGRSPSPRFSNVALSRQVAPASVGRTYKSTGSTPVPSRGLAEKEIIEHYSPVGALVTERGEILYLLGRIGQYLELPPGEVGINNIQEMAREGLQPALDTALKEAMTHDKVVRCQSLRVIADNQFTTVDLTVRPLPVGADARRLFLIVFERLPLIDSPSQMAQHPRPAAGRGAAAEARQIAPLREKLEATESRLQAMQEALQSANEDLRSSSEEMQSMNEELQSANEELETSTEELQSVNEELSTVNHELQAKVVALSQTSSDMQNLLVGLDIGTIFVDLDLRIKRFTPAATQLINLILSDVGRPVAHVVSNLIGYNRLVADIEDVLEKLVPKEIEVQTDTGRWFLLRIRPYRSLENAIDGAVITFTDIHELKKAQAALTETEATRRLAAVLRDARDAIMVWGLDGQIMAWNPGAERLYGWTEAEVLGRDIRNLTAQKNRGDLEALLAKLKRAEHTEPYRLERVTKDDSIVEVLGNMIALIDTSGAVYAIAVTETERTP